MKNNSQVTNNRIWRLYLSLKTRPIDNVTLDNVIRRHVILTIIACQGNVKEAVGKLKVGRTTFYRWLKKWESEK